jgi:mono/diheme cytochrome c family protein
VFILAVDASPQKAIGYIIILVGIVGLIGYMILENRVSPTDNVRSMLQAPNRKAPPDDEIFEGRRLDRFLSVALIGMCLTALALPVYWLGEPGRQEGAVRGFDKRSVKRGERAYEAGGFGCINCHGAGGGGGVAPWFAPEYGPDGRPKLGADGKVVSVAVNWAAPAVKDVALRYQKEQLKQVLYYGRGANKPMPAWHIAGGGPGNDQQIDDVIHYLQHLALEGNKEAEDAYLEAWKSNGYKADDAYKSAFAVVGKTRREESQANLDKYRADAAAAVKSLKDLIGGKGATDLAGLEKILVDAKSAKNAATYEGDQAIKKAEKDVAAKKQEIADAPAKLAAAEADLAKGDGEVLFEQNCARCHTPGYSFGKSRGAAKGWYGPALNNESLIRQFPKAEDQAEFIKKGTDASGRAYGVAGVNGWDGGGMPYFENILTDEMIDKIVEYERNLGTDTATKGAK